MIFLGVAGILAIVRKDEPKLSDKITIEQPIVNDKKYCGYCGAEMAAEGIFCPECRKKQPEKATEI
jgi:tRNA(Ile2) C34 agmatinyltransferase TiaS